MAVILTKPPVFSLRPARQSDYDFAARLYLDSMKRQLTTLGRWDEARVTTRFRRSFKPAQAKVIRLERADVGWMQVSHSAKGFHLHQLHLIERCRNRGIGTRLIQALLARAAALDQPVALNVVHGNPAVALYRRLGFRPISRGAEKLRMRWDATRSKNG